jgi:radical SAM family uncharacterized protein/radical SAM-linked protein
MYPAVHKRKGLSDPELINLLSEVLLPSQYIGCEFGSIIREPAADDIRVALAFHDTYEIGMSYLGFRILYAILNSQPGIYAERVFAPWRDMEDRLRKNDFPLFSLETKTPLDEFDIIGFTLQYELGCTNILTILDLAGIPLRSEARNDAHPLIIAGGPVAFNPEPFSPFFDAFFIGDAEEGFVEIIEKYRELKNDGVGRKKTLESIARIKSVYVPSLTITKKEQNSGIRYRLSGDGKELSIERRTIPSFDRFPFPAEMVVPFGKVVQDKVSIELSRGCARGCRFCQAGYIYLPSRERNANQIAEAVIESVKINGYDEVSFTGLTPTDYPQLECLIRLIHPLLDKENISLSLSSVRTEKIPDYILEVISSLRKTGFTLAPEAGTQRMRNVINKNLSEEQILDSIGRIYHAGWRLIKLYFMIGLPTETDEDISAISLLAETAIQTGRVHGIRPQINLSISPFVPKPHTPFQWEKMDGINEIHRKMKIVKRSLRSRGIEFKYHKPELSFLEGLITRGDIGVAEVIERAWRMGARFDGWSEFDNIKIWNKAIEESGIKPEVYLNGFPPGSHLPWEHIKCGVKPEFLARERKRAYSGQTSSGCGGPECRACGICPIPNNDLDSSANIFPSPDGNPMPVIAIPESDGKETDEPSKNHTDHTVFYERTGIFIYLSHFDTVRTLIRALKRAGLRFAYTRGFHPKPVVAFPPPLPVGVAGSNEFFDLTSDDCRLSDEIIENANATLPEGFKLLRFQRRESRESLSSLVKGAFFSVRFKDELAFEDINNYNIKWEELLNGTEPILYRDDKKGHSKEKDLRLLISDLKINLNDKRMTFVIKYHEQGSINPIRFLKIFFSEVVDFTTIRREAFLFE